jgi:hypothetical protein
MGIALLHHTGLGDHFMCNGLVHQLADKYGEVDLFCKEHLYKTINHLYMDFPNIKIIPIKNDSEDPYRYAANTQKDLVRVGFEHTDFNRFEESFYEQVGLDVDDEFAYFQFPSDLSGSKKLYEQVVAAKGKDYIFVHNVSPYKAFDLKIESTLPRFVVNKTDTDDVLDYIDTICNAKEVHIINSGLHNLVFQLLCHGKVNSDNVFFHDARKPKDGGIAIRIPSDVKVIQYD